MKKFLSLLLSAVLLIPTWTIAESEKPAYEFSKKDFEKTIAEYSNEDLLSILEASLSQLQSNKFLDKETVSSINTKVEAAKILNSKSDSESKLLSNKEIKAIYSTFNYKDYMRKPEKYNGDKFLIKGRVSYVDLDDAVYQISTKRYSDQVWVKVPFELEENFVVGDSVELCVTSTGEIREIFNDPLFILDENTPIIIK